MENGKFRKIAKMFYFGALMSTDYIELVTFVSELSERDDLLISRLIKTENSSKISLDFLRILAEKKLPFTSLLLLRLSKEI